MKGIIGKKLGMTQVYDEKGKITPVTVVQAGPCVVLERKTKEKHGYEALQLGYGERKAKNVSKAVKGHCEPALKDALPPSVIREVKIDSASVVDVGGKVTVEIFKEGDFVDVVGVTKGRGFQGVVMRHHFAGGRASHGGGWHRRGGSIGQKEQSANVVKGKKMPGQLGNAWRTTQNLLVVKIDPAEHLLFIKGALPGATGGVLTVTSAIKKPSKQA